MTLSGLIPELQKLFVGSKALLRPERAASLTRPGRSLPCSCVDGFSSSNTFSALRFGNFASPSFRRNSAFRPSPTNTKALWGIFNMASRRVFVDVLLLRIVYPYQGLD